MQVHRSQGHVLIVLEVVQVYGHPRQVQGYKTRVLHSIGLYSMIVIGHAEEHEEVVPQEVTLEWQRPKWLQ